jgi:hypothetical protein
VLWAQGRYGVDSVAGSGMSRGRRHHELMEDNDVAGLGTASGQWCC